MVLHRKGRSAAPALAMAIAFACPTASGQSVEELVGEQVEDEVGLEVESELVGQLERALEADVLGALLDGTAAAAGLLAGVPEIVRQRHERFVAELDAGGRAIERDVLVALVPPERLAEIGRLGLAVREQRALAALGLVLVRLDAPAGRERDPALLDAPGAPVDANHLYRAGAVAAAGPAVHGKASSGLPAGGLAVGMVDSDVSARHPALRAAEIVERDFVPYRAARPTAHGTAVASLLVGDAAGLDPPLRGARLYAASVLFDDGAGGEAATAASLVRALDWLLASGVRVINVSLAGPPNRVLEAAIEGVSARGVLVVAAVGNAGPAAGPLYPAAYEPVVGVTAVDAGRRVYLHANRGPQVGFAARGVGVAVAADGGLARVSGTSYAAPLVAACLVRALAANEGDARRALAASRAAALDLGPPGFDETFGFGLLPAGTP